MKYINIIFLTLLSLFLVFGSGCIDAVEENDVDDEAGIMYEAGECINIKIPMSFTQIIGGDRPSEVLYEYEYVGEELPKEGDFIVTKDEFNDVKGRSFFGHVTSEDEFKTYFEVYEYDTLNVPIEDGNAAFRKFIFDEFGIKENVEKDKFLFKDTTVIEGYIDREFIAFHKELTYDSFVTEFMFIKGEYLFITSYDRMYSEIFTIENETEFMGRYEVIEYVK